VINTQKTKTKKLVIYFCDRYNCYEQAYYTSTPENLPSEIKVLPNLIHDKYVFDAEKDVDTLLLELREKVAIGENGEDDLYEVNFIKQIKLKNFDEAVKVWNS
jgi:hypothetical protein